MRTYDKKELFERCLNASYTHTAEDGDYAIELEGDTLYLLFQWSHSHMDWVSNFDFPAKAYKNGEDTWYCHRGFLRVWKAMRDEIEEAVQQLLGSYPDILNIVCVGYSHGAAIALLATEDMVYLHEDRAAIIGYGFGAPRVVWDDPPIEVSHRLGYFTAVRNIPDIVTHLPPAVFGFKHINLEKVGKLGKYNPIDAHRPESYLAELSTTDTEDAESVEEANETEEKKT